VTRRLAIYGAIVALLIAAGVSASIFLFGPEAERVLPVTGPALTTAPPPTSKPVAASSTEPDAAAPAIDEVTVIAVQGDAERSGEEEDAWSVLTKGTTLSADDKVRTGDHSRLTLGVGQGSRLELAERAELRVGETSDKDRRFKLLKGRISVEYKREQRTLRIENEDGSAVAETEEGVFTVLNTGATVAVATKTGSVDLFSGGTSVAVNAGEQSVSAGGRVPTRPAPIPVDVMLKVVDPGCKKQRERYVVVNGRATPGSAVTANGTEAKVRYDGRFSVRVPLKLGKNNIVVVTEDALGRTKRRSFPCVTVKPNEPVKKVDIKWGPSYEGQS